MYRALFTPLRAEGELLIASRETMSYYIIDIITSRVFLYKIVCIAFLFIVDIAKCTNYTLHWIKIVKRINVTPSVSVKRIENELTRACYVRTVVRVCV